MKIFDLIIGAVCVALVSATFILLMLYTLTDDDCGIEETERVAFQKFINDVKSK